MLFSFIGIFDSNIWCFSILVMAVTGLLTFGILSRYPVAAAW